MQESVTATHKTITSAGYFTLSFGTIVGSAWVVLLGEWLRLAGPGGAMLGFAAGTAFMLLLSAYYGELACRMPLLGGEATYAAQILGRTAGFFVAWFLILFMLSFCAFEGIALGWLLETLFPAVKGAPLYVLGDKPVTSSSAVIGMCGVVAIALLNVQRVGVAILAQKIITFSFISAGASLIVAGLIWGDPANIQPMFPVNNGGWFTGTIWIFATCATFLTGFQAALHAIEERAAAVTPRRVVLSMMAGVAVAGAFYVLLILSASRAAPWQTLVKSDLPAAAAFGALHGAGYLRSVVLAVAAISLFKTWNALTLMTSRLIYAKAQDGILPDWLGKLGHGSNVPINAVLTISLLAAAGILMGRWAIIPILNTASVSSSAIYIVSLCVLIKLRRTDASRAAMTVPGGLPLAIVTLLGLSAMAAIAFAEPLLQSAALPVEWVMLITWLGLGAIILVFKRPIAIRAQHAG